MSSIIFMSSGGRLSREQKGKAIASNSSPRSSPLKGAIGHPLAAVESIYREAMMDTENMDTPQRTLVAESVRQLREERASFDAQAWARDGCGGASDGEDLSDFVPTCYHPGGIFEDLPALSSRLMSSSTVEGQSWENVEHTRLTPSSVKILLRRCSGVGVTLLIPSRAQRPWSPPVGFQCV